VSVRVKRILMSQRSDAVPGRDEVRDGLDIRFAGLVWDLGFAPIPVSSAVPDPRAYVDSLRPDAILLTGGNDIGTMPARDATEAALLDHAAQTGVPVFALCRGLQFLNHYQGGALTPASGHVATRHRISGPLAPRGREVNSYHNIGIRPEGLGRDLIALATADDGGIEAACHRHLPWLGVMWHPEREPTPEPEDLRLMRAHLTGGGDFISSLQRGVSL